MCDHVTSTIHNSHTLSICLSVCLSISLSIYLSIYLSLGARTLLGAPGLTTRNKTGKYAIYMFSASTRNPAPPPWSALAVPPRPFVCRQPRPKRSPRPAACCASRGRRRWSRQVRNGIDGWSGLGLLVGPVLFDFCMDFVRLSVWVLIHDPQEGFACIRLMLDGAAICTVEQTSACNESSKHFHWSHGRSHWQEQWSSSC